jgi:hypothetical protein
MQLKCPEIDVTGEVVTTLNKLDVPVWMMAMRWRYVARAYCLKRC